MNEISNYGLCIIKIFRFTPYERPYSRGPSIGGRFLRRNRSPEERYPRNYQPDGRYYDRQVPRDRSPPYRNPGGRYPPMSRHGYPMGRSPSPPMRERSPSIYPPRDSPHLIRHSAPIRRSPPRYPVPYSRYDDVPPHMEQIMYRQVRGYSPMRIPRGGDPRGDMMRGEPPMRGDPRGEPRGDSRDPMRDSRGDPRDLRDPREHPSMARGDQRGGDTRGEPRVDLRGEPPRTADRGVPQMRGDGRGDPRRREVSPTGHTDRFGGGPSECEH